MSLAEVLISSALMLLLLGSTMAALVAGKDRAARSSTQVLMEEEALSALTFVTTDLSETNLAAVHVPSDQFVVFPLPRNAVGKFTVEPDGKLRWSTLIAYRAETINGEPHLIRQIADVADSVDEPMDPKFMTAPVPDAAYFARLSSPKRETARGFQRLEVVPDGRALKLALEVSSQIGNRTLGLVLRSTVMPRN